MKYQEFSSNIFSFVSIFSVQPENKQFVPFDKKLSISLPVDRLSISVKNLEPFSVHSSPVVKAHREIRLISISEFLKLKTNRSVVIFLREFNDDFAFVVSLADALDCPAAQKYLRKTLNYSLILATATYLYKKQAQRQVFR